MITKVAEWSSILSFAYLVVASIWSEKFNMNINLIFNIVMFLILIGSLVIFIREKYKGVTKRFDDIAPFYREGRYILIDATGLL